MAQMTGILARAQGTIFGDKVFYLNRGKRHWVPSGEWIRANGFDFTRDVHEVSEEWLLTYLPGQPAPLKRPGPAPQYGIATVGEAREIAASQVTGIGVEIGAFASPFPVPLEALVQYADYYSYEELLADAYEGQALHDIVVPTIRTELDTLTGIQDASLDFLVACHVIEHTRDPIGVIKNCYAKLRTGGKLVLVIPDKERTFDRNRPLTAMDHLIEDFNEPNRDRDVSHFKEFYSLAEGFIVTGDEFEKMWRSQWEKAFPIHYHTWNYSAFGMMIDWTLRNAAPFEGVWSHPTVPDGIEFYFTLTK